MSAIERAKEWLEQTTLAVNPTVNRAKEIITDLISECEEKDKRIAELEEQLAKLTLPASNIHSIFCGLCKMDWANGACGDCTVTREQLDYILATEHRVQELQAELADTKSHNAGLLVDIAGIQKVTAADCAEICKKSFPYNWAHKAIKEKYGV